MQYIYTILLEPSDPDCNSWIDSYWTNLEDALDEAERLSLDADDEYELRDIRVFKRAVNRRGNGTDTWDNADEVEYIWHEGEAHCYGDAAELD